jgi:CelD/BcsL family acetyltransferase involved in cellulose biosynthesis
VDVTADPAAPAMFMAIEERGWKGKAGGALASAPSTQRWFEEMCAGMAAAGKLQLLALRAADETVAVQQNLVDGDLIYALKTTYDESYARFSPGALLEAKSIEVFHERADLVAMDSCAQPGAELFERIWPDRRRLQKVIVPTGAWYASLVVRAIRAERRLAKAWRRIRPVERGALAE